MEVAGPGGRVEPSHAGWTQDTGPAQATSPPCGLGEGPHLHGLSFVICELGITSLPTSQGG